MHNLNSILNGHCAYCTLYVKHIPADPNKPHTLASKRAITTTTINIFKCAVLVLFVPLKNIIFQYTRKNHGKMLRNFWGKYRFFLKLSHDFSQCRVYGTFSEARCEIWF